MSETLEERYRKFQMLELPGQPRGMHMGTSYLMNDMWDEIVKLRAALEMVANDVRSGSLPTPIQNEISSALGFKQNKGGTT